MDGPLCHRPRAFWSARRGPRGFFARGSAFPALPHPQSRPYVRTVDVLNPILGLVEKVFSGFRQAARADLRIADQARLLRRQLAASFADWPQGPKTDFELLTWAHKAARGFDVTRPGIDDLVRLRPEALRSDKRALGEARDGYYGAADLISPAIKTRWRVVNGESTPEPVDPVPLRKAFALFKRCIAALDAVVAAKGAQ